MLADICYVQSTLSQIAVYSNITKNTADDFASKTTFAHPGVKDPCYLIKQTLQDYNIDTVEKYVNDIKPLPYKKLLSSMESNTHGESTNIEIEDIERHNEIVIKYEDRPLEIGHVILFCLAEV